jgi:hypothetical protein
MIENGFVHIPETAPWLDEYLHEITVFPKGKHDDQVDSTAQFLDWFKVPMPSWCIFEATRRRAEALDRSPHAQAVAENDTSSRHFARPTLPLPAPLAPAGVRQCQINACPCRAGIADIPFPNDIGSVGGRKSC